MGQALSPEERKRLRAGRIEHRLARALGYELVPIGRDEHATVEQHVALLIRRLGVNCVIDVGANVGQYARSLREAGYRGRIVSFEPAADSFAALRLASGSDPEWQVRRIALGSRDGRQPLLHCGNPLLASFRPPSDRGRRHFGLSETVEEEVVETRRLDGLVADLTAGLDEPRLLLKLDTQGYDLEVFAGASGCLPLIRGLQSELSVVPCYEGMPDYLEALAAYRRAGFEITGLYPIFRVGHHLVIGEFDAVMAKLPQSVASGTTGGTGGTTGRATPQVSVLVCSHGESPGLESVLDAVREQAQAMSAETVLVLNTARDRFPAARLGALERLCDRVLFEPRPGKSNALNTGVRACRGAVVAATDDDTMPQAGWLERLTAPLLDERRPAELAGCGGPVVPVLPPGDVPQWYRDLLARRSNHFLGPSHDLGPAAVEYSLTEQGRRAVPFGANCAYRRDVLLRFGFDPDLGPNRVTGLRGGEDYKLGWTLLREGYRLFYCPGAVVHHPVDPERITHDFVQHAYFMQGVEHVRLCRFMNRPLPHLGRTRWMVVRTTLSRAVALAASESRRVRVQCKLSFRRGLLAELEGRGPTDGSGREDGERTIP